MQLLEAVFTLPELLTVGHHRHVFVKLSLREKRIGLKTEAEDGSFSFR